MRYTRSPSVFSDSSLSASFLRTTAAKNPRTVCGCQPVEVMIAAMVAPLGWRSSPQHPRLLRIRSPVVLAAAGCLRPHFGWSLRLGSSPTFALGHPKLLSLVPAQHRAATTQTPRRPTGAGGGEDRSHQACCP